MTVSLEQKVDFLLKKLGYTASKTGIAEDSSLSGTKKAPFAEALPSPLVVPNTSVWNQSGDIPATPPGSSSSIVEVYDNSSAFQMTMDNTVSGKRTFLARSAAGNNSSDMVGDWVDTQFGADYIVNVYKGDPNSDGVKLAAAGSGSGDSWFFDYSSGVLNFNGDNVPSGVTETNIYIVGYRYIGDKGVTTSTVSSNIAATQSNIDLIFEKMISMDDRIEKLGGITGLVLNLEDSTPTTASVPFTESFIDEVADGDTSIFVVTLDPEREVYLLDGVAQPTVQCPRGDILKFNTSGLPVASDFRIFHGGSELSSGVNISAGMVTVTTGSISNSITKIFYRSATVAGRGWVIEITDN